MSRAALAWIAGILALALICALGWYLFASKTSPVPSASGTSSSPAWLAQFPHATSTLPMTFHQIPETYNGRQIELPAWLTLPQGSGPFPVVVMIAGSDGLWGAQGPRGNSPNGWTQYQFWTAWYVSEGYATLVVDSFTPRGIVEQSGNAVRAEGGTPPSVFVILPDFYASADFLTALPSVDPHKMFIMGDSLSGGAVLHATGEETQVKTMQSTLAQAGGRILAAVALYPGCSSVIDQTFSIPTLIFQGEKDETVQAPMDCAELGARSRTSGAPVTVVMYQDATHVYDVNKPPRTPLGAGLDEYDAPATADTQARIASFLAQYLGPSAPQQSAERSTLIYSQAQ